MRICVFGATGKTGGLIVERALEQGHVVTAVARSVEKLQRFGDKIRGVECQLDDEPAIARAIGDQEAVVSALGTVDRKPNTILSNGTARIITAMNTAKVKRFVAITSHGCRESLGKVTPWLFKELVVKRVAKEIWADKNRQEEHIESSNLSYTIVRPGGLSDTPAKGSYQVFELADSLPPAKRLPRADLAAFILKTIDDRSTYRKILTIVQPK